jgi:hypothetical protein
VVLKILLRQINFGLFLMVAARRFVLTILIQALCRRQQYNFQDNVNIVAKFYLKKMIKNSWYINCARYRGDKKLEWTTNILHFILYRN